MVGKPVGVRFPLRHHRKTQRNQRSLADETVDGRTIGSLVVEDCQVELAEARGIGDHVDLDDLPAPDREAEYY